MIRYSNYWRFIIWLIARVKYFIFAILISLLNFQFDSSLKNQILHVIYPTNNIFLYKHQNGERDLKLLYIYIYIMRSCLEKDWETLFWRRNEFHQFTNSTNINAKTFSFLLFSFIKRGKNEKKKGRKINIVIEKKKT